MNLRERLRVLRPAATTTEIASRGAAAIPGESSGDSAHKFNIDKFEIDKFGDDVELRSFPTDQGSAIGAEVLYPLEHKQGRMALEAALTVPRLGWERMLPMAKERFPVEQALFFDLETTGLSRGTGTYAFLIGVGRFVDDGFRLRQFFLRDYDDEHNVLQALSAELKDVEAIVSFNGRSFDWPLLETRATMNRLRLPRLRHLDLLHTARRLWRPIIGGCSLSDLESEVLGFQRHDDVPGYLIPRLYFDFLQTGDVSPLSGVLVHNRVDILSMVALAAYVGHAMADPRYVVLGDEKLSGGELFTIGRALLPDPEGISCLEEALYRGLPNDLRRQCSRLLATTYRRIQRFDDAVAVWEKLATDDGFSTWAFIELAKHYEHRARDLRTARQWTMRALDLVLRRRSLAGPGIIRLEQDLADIVHRLQRIERKIRS